MLVFILFYSLIPAQIFDIIYNSVIRSLIFNNWVELSFTSLWGIFIIQILINELVLFLIKRKKYINIYKRKIKIEKK